MTFRTRITGTLLCLTLMNLSACAGSSPAASRATTPDVAAMPPLKILLANDDGLTANIRALRAALVAAGHQVIVAIPCQNQSGKGAAVNFLTPIDTLAKDCRNGAAKAGAPGVGTIATLPDAWYVDGTPVMATAYGIGVAAPRRWGSAPDLVISGPNEGQNLGAFVIGSGTVSNAQTAMMQGIPAIAISADINTTDNPVLAAEAAQLTLTLLASLQRSGEAGRLPAGLALNVNLPKFAAGDSAQLQWRTARFGNVEFYRMRFVEDLGADPMAAALGLRDVHKPGISFVASDREHLPADADPDSEALMSVQGFITVTPMQAGYEMAPAPRQTVEPYLNRTLEQL
jgi:5'-nucleotidase